jgi:chemotaxis protein MotA
MAQSSQSAQSAQAEGLKGSGAKGPAAPKSAKGAGVRPDLSTLAGIAIALAGILGGLLLEKGKMSDVVQGTAAMIVLGGTFGAVLVTTPLPVFLRGLRALRGVFLEQSSGIPETIEDLIGYAAKARKNGIVSLEMEAVTIQDPFLKKALGLAVDGTDLQEMRKMMETDILLAEQSGEAEAKVWEAAGGYAPTIGIIGAVMGLIQVMKHLEDIKEVGHGIAVAFVATVYGVGTANILFLPIANKLRTRTRAASLLKEMTLEGVIGIIEGLNPTLIRLKLNTYDLRPKSKEKPKPKEKGAPAKPPAVAKVPAA